MEEKHRKAAVDLLSGEWEITCGLSKIVWGEAFISRLSESCLLKRMQGSTADPQVVTEDRIPCSFKVSRDSPMDIQVKWGKEGGPLTSATLAEHGPEWLRWKLAPRISDVTGYKCYAIWRRKQRKEKPGLQDSDSLSCSSSISFAVSEDAPTAASSSAKPVIFSVHEEDGGQLPPGWRRIGLTADTSKFMYLHETGQMQWLHPSISKPRPLAQASGPSSVEWFCGESYTPPTSPIISPKRLDENMSLTPPTSPPNTPNRQKLGRQAGLSSSARRRSNRSFTPPRPRSSTPPLTRCMSPQARSRNLPITPRNKKLEFPSVLETTPVKWSLSPQDTSYIHAHLMPSGSPVMPKRSLTPLQSTPSKKNRASPGAKELIHAKRPNKAVLSPEWTPERSPQRRQDAPESTPERSIRTDHVFEHCERSAYVVLEVATKEQQDKVWELHSQKVAFATEHHHLKSRIYDNENGMVQCRSWLLADIKAQQGQPLEFDTCASTATFVSAMTVRLNPYMHQSGLAWAQVMNVSVAWERNGHGTRLVAGVEELLLREGVDVVVLYPVDNNRATNFWSSMGYVERRISHLPPEELDPESGALLPEGYMEQEEKVMLARWEKRLTENSTPRTIHVENEGAWKTLKREQWPLWRKVAAELCRLGPEELEQRFKEAQNTRDRLRAWLEEGMRAYLNPMGAAPEVAAGNALTELLKP